MSKRNKIIYWVATLWLALGMLSTAIVQLIKVEEEVGNIIQLGYPVYLLTILGIWKILGVVVILIPKFGLFKEWAYAGFFFVASGAIASYVAAGQPITSALPAALILALTVVSWCFRPDDRRVH